MAPRKTVLGVPVDSLDQWDRVPGPDLPNTDPNTTLNSLGLDVAPTEAAPGWNFNTEAQPAPVAPARLGSPVMMRPPTAQAAPAVQPPATAPMTYEGALNAARQQLVEDPTRLSASQQLLLSQDRGASAGGGGPNRLLMQEAGNAAGNARALDERRAGRLDVLGAEQDSAAQDLARRQEDIANELQQNAAERQSMQEQHAVELDKLTKQLVSDRDRYVAAADSVDPSRLTRGKEWLVGMSVGLGAFGAAFSGGGRNYAQESLNAAIDRDLDTQKGGVAARKEAASITQQIFAQKRAQFSDQEAAKLATRADVLDIGAHLIAARSQKMQGTEAAAAQSNAADEIRKQAEMARAQALQLQAKAFATKAQPSSLEQRAKASELMAKIAAGQTAVDKANDPTVGGGGFTSHLKAADIAAANPRLRFNIPTLQQAIATRAVTASTMDDIKDANYALNIHDKLVKTKAAYDKIPYLARAGERARTLARTYQVHTDEWAAAAGGKQSAMGDREKFAHEVPDINNPYGLQELKTSLKSGLGQRYAARLGVYGTTIPGIQENEASELPGSREPVGDE
jgi:hypothetical protein